MQVHQVQAGWQQYAVMLVVFGVVIALRGRRLMRERPLKPEQLWIVPALYLAIVGLIFSRTPPTANGWLVCLVALLVGAAAGWQRGKTMRIHVDPASGKLMQRGSVWAVAVIAVLVAVKMAAQTEGPAMHFDVNMVIDGLAAFSLGLFAMQRVEMYLRAQRLLAAV